MLPEDLVEEVIEVEVDRGDGDVSLGFGAVKHVRAEHQHITNRDWFLSCVADQDG